MAAQSISKKTSAFDFKQAVEQMLENDPLIDKDSSIAIYGGEFVADKLSDFLGAWDFTAMPYRIWEFAHRISFTREEQKTVADSVRQNSALLERGRVFGANEDLTVGGDLSLRRDENRFLWHFIGASSDTLTESLDKLREAQFTVSDFWQENPACRLRRGDESALLWGDYKGDYEGGSWQENRVGWAELNYPINESAAKSQGQRVEITYSVFTEEGQVAFVWWKELKQHG